MIKSPFPKVSCFLFFVFASTPILLISQEKINESTAAEIGTLIESFKNDDRGPYKDIRWFCPDGSNLPAREPCEEKGGFQRARYKDKVDEIADKYHIYLGQILSGTEKTEFYDARNNNSRLKQYLLEQFLYAADDGWIQKKSRYYRGAVQDEDESAWGLEFLKWVLEGDRFSEENYFLVRELVKYLPHKEETNLVQRIRSVSKQLSEERSDFMPLRVKIHGNPSQDDIEKIRSYLITSSLSFSATQRERFNTLIADMESLYNRSYKTIITPRIKVFKESSELRNELEYYASLADNLTEGEELVMRTSDLLSLIKRKALENNSASARLALLDISVELEQKLLSSINNWKAKTILEIIEKSCYLGQVSAATGHIYDWELSELYSIYSKHLDAKHSLSFLYEYFKNIRRNINWGSAMINTEFESEISLFNRFEPLATSFLDDRIRSSVLLSMGEQASRLNDYIVDKAGINNRIFGKKSGEIYGVNPGYAKGKLIVLDALDTDEIDPAAIYAFRKPPDDLEPVSGILSISEGNVVSHIQLLARNLGIPNSTITEDIFNLLKKYDGRDVFYAVSQKGGVVLKVMEEMLPEEIKLFVKAAINEEIIRVPVDQLELGVTDVLSISEVDASSSGILCGPKAANFARLKKMFPDNLVNGLVVPFGIFKEHMLQLIPSKSISYWEHLQQTFAQAASMKESGERVETINAYCLTRLDELSTLIKQMPLKPGFVSSLEQGFMREFEKDMGDLPVFLRSDTNMEDLKDFTGAGLNLTLFNLVSKSRIIQGIKDVWASPYTERSFKWRQKFLTNPEEVYPSILIIPSVFVDKSGVVITKDFLESEPGSLNAAFSPGVGGAVDGQKAESWILRMDGSTTLVSPGRDREYKYLLPSGSTSTARTLLSEQLLNYENIRDVWKVCMILYKEMPQAGMPWPYDIELGFQGEKLWLFQIRPFVENKKAGSSFYLNSLDPHIPENVKIKLNEEI